MKRKEVVFGPMKGGGVGRDDQGRACINLVE
jgi:hypothetical protein